jgi:hypothetical protein
MDEIARKNELLQSMAAVELTPAVVKNEIATQQYSKLSLSRMTALGTGLEPIVTAVQQITSNGKAVSGYYKVTIPKGTSLASFKDGTGFLGTALDNHGIVGQARLNPLVCNPTMLLVAVTLANIDKKLDALQETQQEMLNFIVQKEKSELKGDLDFLLDVFNNYKHNWNSEKYKAANHIKVLDIRQNAGRKIDFYQEMIKKHLGKKVLLHSDQDVKKQLMQVQDELKDYQLSLYLYGFAYFLEVLLQENFDAAYLDSIAEKINTLAFQYRELYSAAYTQIEGYTKSSLQARALRGLSIANKAAGNAIAKIPVISKSQLVETLIEAGRKIGTYEEKRAESTMHQLIDRQSSCILPFIDQINTINRVYNNPMTLVFNNETLYLGSA